MKRKSFLGILTALLLICCIGLGVVAFAEEETSTTELLFTDDCKSAESSNIYERDPHMWVDKHGFKVSDATQAYIVFRAEKDIEKIELKIWHTDGFGGFEYGLAQKNINVEIFVSADGETNFVSVPYTYAADTSDAVDGDGATGKFVILTANDIPQGNKFFKVVLTTTSGFWWPQLSEVKAYGSSGSDPQPPEEDLLFEDDGMDLSSKNIADKSADLTIEHGIKRTTAEDGYVTFTAGGEISKIQFRLWTEKGTGDIDYALALGNKIYNVYVSDSATSGFEEVQSSYVADTEEGSLYTFVTVDNIPAGKTYFKITMSGNVIWNPQISQIKAYGSDSGEPQPPEEEPIFTDACTDLLEAVYFDSNLKNDIRGITRSNSEPGALVYDAGQSVGRVELLLNVTDGYAGWIANPSRDFYNVRIFAGESKNGPFSELEYEVSEYSAVSDGWGLIKVVSEHLNTEARFIKILLDAPKSTWHVCIRQVDLYEQTEQTIDVQNVVITKSESELLAGSSAVFEAETDPAGGIVYFSVYDDETLTSPSQFAQFDGNTLFSEYEGTESKIVYVAARCGNVVSAPVSVEIKPRPDAESVTFTANKTDFVNGETVLLDPTVLPAEAINKTVIYAAYLDEGLTQIAEDVLFEGNIMSLAEGFTKTEFYVVARVQKTDGDYVQSEPLKFTVTYKTIIFKDACSDLSKVNKDLSDVDIFGSEKGFVRRFFPEMIDTPQYASLGAGSQRTDKAKYDVPSVVYNVNTAIDSFTISIIAYDEGNMALNEENKNNFIGLMNIYVSETGEEGTWTYVQTDFTASLDVGALESGAYTRLDFFNTQPLPQGTKYIRIDLLGQISKSETENNGSYSYVGYSGITLQEEYKDIVLYYNVYSPFLAGVSLYAVGEDVEPELNKVYGEEGQTVRAGDENGLTLSLFKTYSDASQEEIAFTAEDLANAQYSIVEGKEFVTVERGVVKVIEGYNEPEIKIVKIVVTLDGVSSDPISVRIVIPVTAVTIAASKTELKTGETLQLTATIAPENASLAVADWYIAEGEGSISANGIFTATKAGTVKIKAVVDGVESNVFTISVTEEEQATVMPAKDNNAVLYICAGVAAAAVIASVIVILIVKKKR